MTAAGSKWGIVMSRNAGYPTQVVELDFLYPSEGIHRRWEKGYRITAAAATEDQAAFILSASKRKSQDVMQETLRTSAFPSTHVKCPEVWYLEEATVVGKSVYFIHLLWEDSVLKFGIRKKQLQFTS
ncbi:hypothetical protein Goari_007983 [Gossypium aridum]|uniref:DUF7477 domain-containing protein n=1 Tax=Gossypium aridum TaxID=34290 RepID=A0A7J8XSQ1_GOSAI|nr:hypothetical protein [Gossypium aridum]